MSNQFVRIIHHDGKNFNNIIFDDIDRIDDDLNEAFLNAQKGKFCRICHDDGDANTLISPCKCTGSLKLVHKACLQKSLSSSNSESCELCKFRYTPHLKTNSIKKSRNINVWQHSLNFFRIVIGGCFMTCIFAITIHEIYRDKGGFVAASMWIQLCTIWMGFFFSAFLLWFHYRRQYITPNRIIYNVSFNIKGDHPSGPELIEILDNNVEDEILQSRVVADDSCNPKKLAICHVRMNEQPNIIGKY